MRASCLALTAVMFVSSGSAIADQVIFKNGDVLTGTIVGYDGSKLTLRTDAAGDLKIDLSKVKTFSSEKPIELKLKDQPDVVKEKALPSAEGAIALDTPGNGRVGYSFDRIKAINPQPTKWTGSVLAGGVIQRGNTYTDTYHAGFDLSRKAEDYDFTADGQYNFGRDKDTDTGNAVTSVDNWLTEAKYDYNLTPKSYAYAKALVAKDRIQDLNLRFIPSVGLGYRWIESAQVNFNTEAGLGWIYEDYSSQSTKEEIAGRLAYHFDWAINSKVKFIHNLEYIPGLQNGSGYLINTDAGLRTDITSNVFVELKAMLTHNSQPAPDKEKDDVQYIFSVGWKF